MNECYSLRVELDGVPKQQVWACRKAAWAIEALRAEQDVGLIYRQLLYP